MMTTRITHLLVLLSLAAMLTACSSSPSRFYTLSSMAKPSTAPAADYAVGVGPVSVPAQVDRQPFTVQVAPNRLEIDEFNRWAAPLNEGIARVVAEDLAVLLGSPHVATLPLVNFDPAYRVSIDIQRFDSLRNPAKGNEGVLVDALWVVRKGGTPAISGRTVVREPTQGDGFDALAAAHSRALAKVSADIAGAIRAQGQEKP